MFFSGLSLTAINHSMKCVLLLAAVYSLIIHQWHKEKGTSLARVAQQQQLVVKAGARTISPVHYSAATQFFALYSNLKNN
jgi:hypothetical protein